jgi:hypothetical protein
VVQWSSTHKVTFDCGPGGNGLAERFTKAPEEHPTNGQPFAFAFACPQLDTLSENAEIRRHTGASFQNVITVGLDARADPDGSIMFHLARRG